MAKLFLFAASCLLAMSISTQLVSAAKHTHHARKSAAHLSANGEKLYHEAFDFVHVAELFLESFTGSPRTRQAEFAALKKEHDELYVQIKELTKHATKTRKVKKQKKSTGEVTTTQIEMEEVDEQFEDDEHMHNFSKGESSHELGHKTLIALKNAVDGVYAEANTLKTKTHLKKGEKNTYHGKVTKLVGVMETIETELGIQGEPENDWKLPGEKKGEFNYSDEDDN